MSEPEFIAALLERTDAMLLLDVSNLYANAHNHGFDVIDALGELPLERIAYVHVGGGTHRDGRYYDTHTDAVVPEVLGVVEELCARTDPPGLLLERDGGFPTADETRAELRRSRRRRAPGRPGEPAVSSEQPGTGTRGAAGGVPGLAPGRGPSPPGFDGDDLAAASASLLRKRLGAVARDWPALAYAVGDGLPAAFAQYAQSSPPPARARAWPTASGLR